MNARRLAVTFGSIGPLVACILHTTVADKKVPKMQGGIQNKS